MTPTNKLCRETPSDRFLVISCPFVGAKRAYNSYRCGLRISPVSLWVRCLQHACSFRALLCLSDVERSCRPVAGACSWWGSAVVYHLLQLRLKPWLPRTRAAALKAHQCAHNIYYAGGAGRDGMARCCKIQPLAVQAQSISTKLTSGHRSSRAQEIQLSARK